MGDIGVIDASFFIAFVMEDEKEFQEGAQSMFDALHAKTVRAYAPPHFPVEAANVLLSIQRRRRINEDQYQRLLSVLDRFPVAIESTCPLRPTSDLAARFELTVYDAAYLELAKRLNAKYLFTFDKALMKAARSEKIATRVAR